MTTTGQAEPDRAVGRWTGVAAVLLGAVAMSVGIGVGLRWLAAGAVTWKSIGASILFGAGAVLCVLGGRWATNGKPLALRVVSIVLLAVVAAVMVWTATPAVMATNVPPTTDSSSDLGMGGRDVRFHTGDGEQLWGWYVPPPDGKTVVIRHGAGSSASNVLAHARVLVANDYGVLMTDARGHGLSEGKAMDFGWYGDEDIRAAMNFLSRQPEVDPSRIAVVGLSMGGEEAIGAAGSDDRVAAVVAEGATARTDEDKSWLVGEYGWRGWLQMKLEWLQYTLADLLTRADRPQSLAASAIGASPRPILMITAGDIPDEGDSARHIAATADNVSVWEVPEAGHIQGLTVAPVDWEATVVGFLEAALGRD